MFATKHALGIGLLAALIAFFVPIIVRDHLYGSPTEQPAAVASSQNTSFESSHLPINTSTTTSASKEKATLNQEKVTPVSRAPEDPIPPTQSEEPTTITLNNAVPSNPPLPVDEVNMRTRAAVVNILCTVTGNDLAPVSGSGVIIDEAGVVLTNAHIGQYVLLQDTSPIAIECFVRTGSPATVRWKPRIMYIPEVWVHEHAADIVVERPTGTGENDFALLALEPIDEPLTLPLPFIPVNVSEGALLTDEQALVASYPAGFAGSLTIYNQLSLTSTLATIGRVFTFSESTIDLLSLGGIIVAQQGSSGGAVVDPWGQLAGLIVTSSDAVDTKDRDLRALTLSHVDRTVQSELATTLPTLLSRNDPRAQAAAFRLGQGKKLGALLTAEVLK